MEIKIIDTDKGQVEYSIVGKEKPVLFLHGGHSNCKETLFHKGFDTNKFQLITPSRPGYGKTPLDDKFTPGKTADLLIALLDYLKIDKVVLYGISAGGLTSIELASRYPERVDKLILASAVSKKWLDENGQVYKTAKKLFNPKTEKIIWGMTRIFSRIFPKMIANNFHPQFSKNKLQKLDKGDVNELLATLRHYNSKTGFIIDIEHNIEREIISNIQCPTLIIHSRNDNSASFEHAEHANKMINNSKLIGLDNEWGHLFWIGKDSNETIKKIIEFIEH
ncbi:Pimeloyl-ACP methyl ester carboxylesterase [Salinimicrobium sediminis]|uniref:Pimeloyl-ACP methyl ester carboxylesterase n=1 Tax=Salinimicrobium sediminis TaxID=1343891 RepID=A0A285X0X1_9FLAO|nr:alpha/beta hydrolase [Salinimicrobium sediminis]SOC78938.1 Pimeloyl-ACP methyl ester carboxylesterase [Salinimicrobium sediminis]